MGSRTRRARWWRQQIASAATPADQLTQAVRWLRALVARNPDTGSRACAAAAQAVADIAAELEGGSR